MKEKLEPAEFMIVSDGGAPASYTFNQAGIPAISDAVLLYRVDAIARSQVSALRTRSLMSEFLSGKRHGILVGLGSEIQNLPQGSYSEYCDRVDSKFHIPAKLLRLLRGLRTSLDRFSEIEVEALLYHSYSMADAFLWSYRDRFPAAFRVDEQFGSRWLIEFTSAKTSEWERALENSSEVFRFR